MIPSKYDADGCAACLDEQVCDACAERGGRTNCPECGGDDDHGDCETCHGMRSFACDDWQL